MPKVNGKSFPYTPKGKKDAAKAKAKMKKPKGKYSFATNTYK